MANLPYNLSNQVMFTKIGQSRIKYWHLFLVIIIVLGIFFRFTNLDKKVYWADENSTSLRISGYTWTEFQEKVVLPGQLLGIEELQQYQQPNSEKKLGDTLNALIGSPEHPPMYFLLARFWVQLWGYSVATIRSLSAVISLLAFPCGYWLCMELFNWRLVGWISIALIAISPLNVLFAQESRQYSLWIVTILLSSAALLKAMRINNKLYWGVYTLSLVLGLYSHTLFILVIASQALYITIIEGFRLSRTFINYCIASATGFVIFAPWLFVIISGLSKFKKNVSWTEVEFSLTLLLKTWMLNFSRIFVDFNYSFTERNLVLQLIIILLSSLLIYSFYFLVRHTPVRVWLFLFSLIGTTFLSLALSDIILGGRRSGIPRYLFTCFLGCQLSVAYLLSAKIASNSLKIWQQKIWQMITAAIITAGVVSCIVSSKAETWWNKYTDIHTPQVAHIINQTDSPLVISPWYSLVSLSYVLQPKTQLQPEITSSNLIEKNEKSNSKVINNIPNKFNNIFVINSRRSLDYLLTLDNRYKIAKKYKWIDKTEPVYQVKTELWQLVKQDQNNNIAE